MSAFLILSCNGNADLQWRKTILHSVLCHDKKLLNIVFEKQNFLAVAESYVKKFQAYLRIKIEQHRFSNNFNFFDSIT